MSKRPPSREDDGEPEAKRLALALAKRANELQQNNAPFGLYQELMPELKLLIAWKMPLRELINWLQTEKALTEPKFLVLFWQTLVKADYRSPLTGKLHRFVEHAEAAFNQYCVLKGLTPTTPAWFEVAAKFWHATFFNASTATRYALYILAESRAYDIWQGPDAFAKDIGIEEAHLVPGTSAERVLGVRDYTAPRYGDFPPLAVDATIARNNWLALAIDSPRRRASPPVSFTSTDLMWEAPSKPYSSIIGGGPVTEGLWLRIRPLRDPTTIRLSAQMMPTDSNELALRGEPTPGKKTLFRWGDRPLILGSVMRDWMFTDLPWMNFTMHVAAIDIDGMLDWVAAHVKNAADRRETYVCATWALRAAFAPPGTRGRDVRIDDMPRRTAEVVQWGSVTGMYYRLSMLPPDEDDPRAVYVEDYLLRVRLPEDDQHQTPTYFSSDTL
jgi:hypothetical protein